MRDSERLENLWAGQFGDEYIERNRAGHDSRKSLWDGVLRRWPASTILEVGCNIGANVQHLATRANVWGIDVNRHAVAEMLATTDAAGGVVGRARSLPFPDAWFDLTLTCGVLIHQPDETLREVMGELVRCSRRWILAGEYVDTETVEVPYRGQRGALFRRDYPGLFTEWFPQLTEVDRWFSDDGTWNRVTFAMFEKP